MQYKKIIFSLLASMALVACQDDQLVLPSDSPLDTPFDDGYSINVTVTLDPMGGDIETLAVTDASLTELENYIDPEKFRVLFFNHEDKFLFESKSRWVKKLSTSNNYNEWLVSVPFYSAGNDVGEYDWDWDAIREALTTNNFKIAILANRPPIEWNLGIVKKYDGNNGTAPEDTIVPYGWFGSNGPHWDKNDFLQKDIFDLHHCQYDPIYDGKNRNGDTGENYYFYDMITDGDPDRPYMGATSSWVQWGENDTNNKDPNGWTWRKTRLPSQDNPIPMYGVQEFKPITNWVKGTPFNLSNFGQGGNTDTYEYQSISLLRSVVKLVLKVPVTKAQPSYVLLWYPNIYARCEPLNNWTPTDQLWEEDHAKGMTNHCTEWDDIKSYGRITITGDPVEADGIEKNRAAYQKRLCWFYGEWIKKGWRLDGTSLKHDDAVSYINSTNASKGISCPKIFNSCIQRNGTVWVDLAYRDNSYYYYVVYCGERNVNDPTNLTKIGDTGSGSPTLIYWMFNISNTIYDVAIVDFNDSNAGNATYTASKSAGDKPSNTTSSGGGMGTYLQAVQNPSNTNYPLPLPLMRNHVYTITCATSGSFSTSSRAGSPDAVASGADAVDSDITYRIDDRASRSLRLR